jgi:DNA polymerase III subunit gamma/tau
VWDTRYRPLVFADVIGQSGSIKVLRARLLKGEGFDTSYIFAGGHGSGKTTLARILARALLCLQPREDGDPCNECDHCKACLSETMGAFTELDAASQGTTADMRRLVDHLAYDYPGVKKRIYLLDEAHRMSRDAQDVLLKSIEDKRVVVLFCTTEYAKLRDTIKSRCEVYEIRKIQRDDILARVSSILEQEKVAYEADAVLTVIDYVRGHVRDVLNRLETIAQLGPITMDSVRERLDLSMVSVYYDALLALGDSAQAVALLESACERAGPAQVASGLAEAAMNAYRHANKIHTDYSALDRERASQVYARFGQETVNIARYFLSLGAYASQIDLVCAAVAFSAEGAVPAVAATTRAVPVPVLIAASPVAPVSAAATTVDTLPAPAAVVKTSVPPARPLPAPPPSAESKPARVFPDGNVPRSKVDEAGMLAIPGRGVGSARQVHKPKAEPTFKTIERPGGLTRSEFTAIVNDALKRGCNGN